MSVVGQESIEMSDYPFWLEPPVDLWVYARSWNGQEARKQGHASLSLASHSYQSNREDDYLPILNVVTKPTKEAIRDLIKGHNRQLLLGVTKTAREYLAILHENVLPALGRKAEDFPIETTLEKAFATRFSNWGQANSVLQMYPKYDSECSLPSPLTVIFLVKPDDTLERYAVAQMLTYPRTVAVVVRSPMHVVENFPHVAAIKASLKSGYWLTEEGGYMENMEQLLQTVYGITVEQVEEQGQAVEQQEEIKD